MYGKHLRYRDLIFQVDKRQDGSFSLSVTHEGDDYIRTGRFTHPSIAAVCMAMRSHAYLIYGDFPKFLPSMIIRIVRFDDPEPDYSIQVNV